ncbi:LytR/AlgR family response regulator transcription factor [Geofilum rhodophaeum]|uniref:LytR/AlgR family response regulator transcription factor n=1 Tax=Geofilum rhodophaeum TaxID=1965019 RepID=UPI000B5224EC|nr:LytTR family DNA-binding domain-containing protein [Geofilum rhodophaeum]
MNTQPTRILIVEDELPSQRLLKNMIVELRPDWQVVATTTGVEETVEWLQNNPHPQLIFLDVQLSDGLSFEIFDQIKPQSVVVFTTAYDEYAIHAFKVNSIDYLLKPIRPEQLEESLKKYERLMLTLTPRIDLSELKNLSALLQEGKPTYRNRILVPAADGFLKLNVRDVAFFHSSQKVTTALTHNQQPHIVDMTLEKLEEELDPDLFFRANRQFLLHIDAIQRIETWFNGKLVVKTRPEADEKIVVSREKARSFKDWINR